MEKFNQDDLRDFLSIKEEINPLIKSLASKVSYKKLGMTYDDVLSFYEEKLLKLFLKYYKGKERNDFKYLVIKSLKNLSTKFWVKETVIRIEDSELEFIIPYYDEPSSKEVILNLFIEFAKTRLSKTEFTIFNICTWPPLYILNRLNDSSKRIPSKLILEYFDKPINKYNIRILNELRRSVEEKIDKLTFEFRDMVA